MMGRRRNILPLAAVLATVACYSYQTLPVEDLRPDVPVRVRVRPDAIERLARVVGYPTQDVDGTVLSRQGDTLLLAVPSPLASQGSSTQRFYQRLDVPISQLIEVQRRELNRTKTYAVAAVTVVGAGALALWAFTSPSIFGNQSTPPVINNALLPAGLVPRPAWQLPLGRLRLGP